MFFAPPARSAPARLIRLLAAGAALLAASAAARGAMPAPSEPTFTLDCPAFRDGRPLPSKFTCAGANVSPALQWNGAPEGTRSFALVCDDPDAPGGGWVHWVLYAIRATAHALPEQIAPTETLPDGSRQGLNSFRKIGYGGPCPPAGERHRYVFTLYALDTFPDLAPQATKRVLLAAIKGHLLAEARLTGLFQAKD
jgi:Raf kinase inhibitor-like YbhB/YbcL family protein